MDLSRLLQRMLHGERRSAPRTVDATDAKARLSKVEGRISKLEADYEQAETLRKEASEIRGK